MSIQTIQAYKVGDTIFQTVEEAKRQRLSDLLRNVEDGTVPEAVLEHADEIISILQWNGESAPAKKTRKTRKDKGTKRSEVKPAVVEGSGKYQDK